MDSLDLTSVAPLLQENTKKTKKKKNNTLIGAKISRE
jgi:hypothetical protein